MAVSEWSLIRWGRRICLILLLLFVAIGGQGDSRFRSDTRLNLEKIAHSDPRIEVVARAMCRAKGIDPDHQGPPYPDGPIWEFFILEARDFLAAYDAVNEWKRQREGIAK